MSGLLDEIHLSHIRVYGDNPVKKFKHILEFRKNNQAMTSWDFKQTHDGIRDILDRQGVNYAILMYVSGTFVFTEIDVDLNPLLVKLSSGTNLIGEVENIKSILNQVNKHLGR